MTPGDPRRLACLSFPHLALLLAWRAHPELCGEALLVGGPALGGRRSVLAVSDPARALGVREGQDWRRAELLCPRAVRLQADLEALAELRRQARLALSGCSPMVEWAADSSAYVDLSGEERGRSEAVRAAGCGRALREGVGLTPGVGVGQSRFTAWAAARSAAPGRVRIVPPGRAAEFLARLPVAQLPISEATVERLLQFGLSSCGDCASISPAELQRQFGPEGLLLHRLCRGQDPARLEVWHQPPPCGVRRVLAGGVEDAESLRFGASELAQGLAQELALRGRAAGRIRLTLRGEEDGGGDPRAWWSEVAPPLPLASAGDLLGPLLGLFGRIHPSSPVQAVELEALELVAPPRHQEGLWPGPGAGRETVQRAVDRLHDRFGKGLVWRVGIRPGHPGDVPEERLAWSSR